MACRKSWPARRPAANLVGVEAKEIVSGSQLVDPRAFTTTQRLTARLTLLPTPVPPKRRTTVEFLAGTAVVRAHIALLDGQTDPHAAGLPTEPIALIRLSAPLVLAFGDVAILRTTGGERTLGAARVLDIAPPDRLRPGVQTTQALAVATPPEAARVFTRQGGLAGRSAVALQQRLGVTPNGLAVLVRSHRRYWHADALDEAKRALVAMLPAPGRSMWLTDWWRTSPIQDRTVLETLTRDIAHVYGLRVHDGLVVTPPAAGLPSLPGSPAGSSELSTWMSGVWCRSAGWATRLGSPNGTRGERCERSWPMAWRYGSPTGSSATAKSSPGLCASSARWGPRPIRRSDRALGCHGKPRVTYSGTSAPWESGLERDGSSRSFPCGSDDSTH